MFPERQMGWWDWPGVPDQVSLVKYWMRFLQEFCVTFRDIKTGLWWLTNAESHVMAGGLVTTLFVFMPGSINIYKVK